LRLVRFEFSGKYLEGKVQSDGNIIDSNGGVYPPEDVTWLPPANPTKIVGIVLNYRDHANELGLSVVEEPVIFLKPPSSLIGNHGEIVYPSGATFMHYEGELCVVIGKQARKVRADNAMKYVKGFTIADDVTVRDFIVNTFRPPVKAKGFDTFCPVGPCLVTVDEISDPSDLEIKTRVNGEIRQEGNTRDLIHPVPQLIEYLSEFMTLMPDDMILTGTPKGISPIKPGDIVEVEIERLGKLSNKVIAEKN
jgi:5-oxopent-3-ene-1,2,5-tricarboxylate decarboxylase / 2-hydroxyhepta-2,4-diene-1,7-dioate isomerase